MRNVTNYFAVVACLLAVTGCSGRTTKVDVPDPLVGDQFDALLREVADKIEIPEASTTAVEASSSFKGFPLARQYSYKVDELTYQLKCDEDARRALMERLSSRLRDRKDANRWESISIIANPDTSSIDVKATHSHAISEIHIQTEPVNDHEFRLLVRSDEKTQ